MKKNLILLSLLSTFYFNAQENKEANTSKENQGINVGNLVNISGTWYVSYQYRYNELDSNNQNFIESHNNEFLLKRGYITLKKDLNEVFSIRYTTDIIVDNEGGDKGNVEARLKYLYLKAKPKLNNGVFTDTWIAVGMVHTPWLDYEQKINTYRVQDRMFIERNRVLNSADFGIEVGGNIGGKMDKEFLDEVNAGMKGKWFSYELGIHNGGGYNNRELNNNKVFSARLSARPFANTLPELHFSGYYNTGKSNSEFSPRFNQFLGMLAYTSKHYNFTGQYYQGNGDFDARYVSENDPTQSLKNSGYSFFGEYKIHKSPFSVWGRYDSFTLDKIDEKEKTERIIGGVAYRLNKNLRIVVDTEFNKKNDVKNQIYELNLEISF